MQDEMQSAKADGNLGEIKMSFVDPVEIIEMSEIKNGEKVADFGCGSGYFSIPAALTVGEVGEVFSFDVLPSALEALESQAKVQGIDNIIFKRVNLEKKEGTELENESIDWVIMKDILFQNKNKEAILDEAKRILKSGGNILVMEWNNNLVIGPDEKSRIAPQDLINIISNSGFVFKKQLDAGDYHYVIIATKL